MRSKFFCVRSSHDLLDGTLVVTVIVVAVPVSINSQAAALTSVNNNTQIIIIITAFIQKPIDFQISQML